MASIGSESSVNRGELTRDPGGRAGGGLPAANQTGTFSLMVSLFFIWGFLTVFNDILIPRFKVAFSLGYFESMLVQFAFFGAYFVGSLAYFLISVAFGDPIARMGYKNGVVLGLLVSAAGSAMYWPAAEMASYPMFLAALFVVGLGFAMLQIAANPFVTILGPENTASSRLNLAQGFNSLGTTLGPLVGGWLIFQYFARVGDHGAESVKVPYLVFSIILLVLAGVFSLVKLPRVEEEKIVSGAGALRHPHVVLGIVAIFLYVGGEVAVGSALINFLGDPGVAGLGEAEASRYLSLYWGGLLIGRFMGAAEFSTMARAHKNLLMVAIPSVACLGLWVVRSAPLDALSGRGGDAPALWAAALGANVPMFAWYLPFVVLCWVMFLVGGGSASRTLALFSLVVAGLLAVAVAVGGPLAMWCVVAVGLFTSIGWSNTFSLCIEGLGPLKSQASSLLVMAILGGAILPPLQGLAADFTGNLRLSFLVPLAAYLYLAFYGLIGYRVGR